MESQACPNVFPIVGPVLVDWAEEMLDTETTPVDDHECKQESAPGRVTTDRDSTTPYLQQTYRRIVDSLEYTQTLFSNTTENRNEH